jgi:hypothetical protein
LVRGSLDDGLVEIIPSRIFCHDQIDLGLARPLLDPLLAMDRGGDHPERLELHQGFDALVFGEAIDQALTMFMHAFEQIVGDADIQRAVWPAGEDVDEVLPFSRHGASLASAGGWVPRALRAGG